MWDRDEVERIFNRRKAILAHYSKDLSDLTDENSLLELKALYGEANTRFESGATDDWTMREVFWVGLDIAKVCHWKGDAEQRDHHFRVLGEFASALQHDEPIVGQYNRWKDVFYPPVGESEVLELERRSKSGELVASELANRISDLVKNGGLNAFLQEKLAWASFRVAKQHLLDGNPEGIEALAYSYSSLALVRPSMAHSHFLSTISLIPTGSMPHEWLGDLGLWKIEAFQGDDFFESSMPDGTKVKALVSRWFTKLMVEGYFASVHALLVKKEEGWGNNAARGRNMLPEAFRNALYRLQEAADLNKLRELLAQYPKGHLQLKASKGHSDVLKWVFWEKKEDPIEFVRWLSSFDMALLRDNQSSWSVRSEDGSDWYRKPLDPGPGSFPSLGEQLIRLAWKGAKELGWQGDELKGLLKWFEAMPEDHGSEWLDRDHAQCLIAGGDSSAAQAIYHRLLARLHKQWWFWWEWSEMMDDDSVSLGMQALSLSLAENEDETMLKDRRWHFAQKAEALGAHSMASKAYSRFLEHLDTKGRQPSEEMTSWAMAHAGSDQQGGPQSLNELALVRLEPWVASSEECAMSIEWVKHVGQVEIKGGDRTRKMSKLSNGRDIEFLVKARELNHFPGKPEWFQSLVLKETDGSPDLGTPFRSVRPVMLVPGDSDSALFGSLEHMVVGYVDSEKGLTLAYCEDGAGVKLLGSGGPWKKGDVLEGAVVTKKPSRKKSEEYSRHRLERQGFPPRAICHLECHSPQPSTVAFDGFKTVEMALIEKGDRWTAVSNSGRRYSLKGLVKDDVDAPLGSLVIAQAILAHRIDRKESKLTSRFEVFEVTIDPAKQGPGLREFHGEPDWTTDRKGNPVGFINETDDSCFIPPHIAEKPDAQSASQWLAHKGDRGWVAFSFSF